MRTLPNKKNNFSGFTLIELLIVIAILGVLSTLVMFTFTGSQRKARDANRKSDLEQYRTALETYANRTSGIYPIHSSVAAANSLCSASELNIANCPVDPKNTGAYVYRYISVDGTKYTLYGGLEQSVGGSSVYFVYCSNGTNLTKTATPGAGDCP